MNSNKANQIDFLREIDFSQILTNPILDIAARVWEPERYAAFQICYRSMRILDNLVDHRKGNGTPISETEAQQFSLLIDDFILKLKRKEADDQFTADLLSVINRFSLPLWPWERLATAMKYDLMHDRFPTFLQFLRYCEGAAIAPAAVFMHLIGVHETETGYAKPEYDIRTAARSLAIFSYLVHILRDFSKDHRQNLVYMSNDLLKKHGVTQLDLQNAAALAFSERFRELIAEYVQIADYYRQNARVQIAQTSPLLAPRYQFSLSLIYELYLQIFEWIQRAEGRLDEAKTAVPPEELRTRIDITYQRFAANQK
jgi:phytoene/squalene synthetase